MYGYERHRYMNQELIMASTSVQSDDYFAVSISRNVDKNFEFLEMYAYGYVDGNIAISINI